MTTMLSVVETYRVDSDNEVKSFIEEMKADADEKGYTLKTYGSDYKEKKQKGEVIDSCYIVKLTKIYNNVWEV